jgi:hypothetical protein
MSAVSSLLWGPQYWFFLHSIAYNYPHPPTKVTKRKYYDLIQNMPLFIPDSKMANNFQYLINQYPVTPYLDSRNDFIRWMHFIHNIVNMQLNKPKIPFFESIDIYNEKYCRDNKKKIRKERHHLFMTGCIVLLLLLLVTYLFRQ